MHENDISYKCIGVALEIHKNIGLGLLESAYENALAYDLRQMGFNVKQQIPMPFIYKEVKQEVGYRIDLLINDKIIIEVKAVESLIPVHYAQLLTYLKTVYIELLIISNLCAFCAASFAYFAWNIDIK